MKKIVFFLIVFSLLCVPLVTASPNDCSQFSDPIMKNDTIDLVQVCTSCSYVNLTSIELPNGTSIVYNSVMTKSDIHYSYSYSPQFEGRYYFSVKGDKDGTVETECFFFEVTANGNNAPEGSTINMFVIIFLIFVGGMLGLLLYTIFHLIQWDFDAKDLIMNVSSYFVLFAAYILGKTYLGNAFIDDFLVWLIGVGGLTMVILPIIAFFISYVKGGLKSNE